MKGATAKFMRQGYVSDISIHAPMKGATLMIPAIDKEVNISIHAPMKGATARCAKDLCSCCTSSVYAHIIFIIYTFFA